jgi:DNA repair protein RecO (recombination protein O)
MRSRIENESAWLLHYRPYRDTSRILDILSRDHGRLSLVARGSRTPGSRLAGILRPFLPLAVSWVMRTDLGTLTGADLRGRPIALSGDALMSGYYINELLLKLLHRHDPQPEIFAAYERTVERLGSGREVPQVLRAFEVELLRLLGYGLILDHDTERRAPLKGDARYEYRIEQGPVEVSDGPGSMLFSGATLIAIRDGDFNSAEVLEAAGRLLRQVIAHHLGGRELRTRRVLVEMRRYTDG